jgi:hypothetical protein
MTAQVASTPGAAKEKRLIAPLEISTHGCANDSNSTRKAEVWIRLAVGTVFAFGAIFCLFKGAAPVETMSFVVATHALLGRPSDSTVAANQKVQSLGP